MTILIREVMRRGTMYNYGYHKKVKYTRMENFVNLVNSEFGSHESGECWAYYVQGAIGLQ